MRRPLQALLLGISLATASPGFAGTNKPQPIRDLHYGEVLFHFYQQDYFTAITHLMAAQKQQLLQHHVSESELLLGGLQLSYGLLEEADRQFRTLLGPDADPQLRHRVWYYLARISHQRGFHERAFAALQETGTPDDATLQAELAVLGANIRMALGQNLEAAESLEKIKEPEGWGEYLRINRGIALLRAGQIDEGRAVLDKLGTAETGTDELKALRDRANLGLGYELLRTGEPQKAREFLNRVRLRGPFVQAALLGAGWADAAQGEFESALTPWLALHKLASFDPPVQEAHLAVPYAFARLGDTRRAIHYYDSAIRYYDGEEVELEQAIDAVESGALLSSLGQVDTSQSGGWLQANDTLENVPAGRYLVDVLSGHDFQEELKNFRDLGFLEKILNDWLERIDVYYDMVDTRRLAYTQHAPVIRSRVDENEALAIEKRWKELRDRVQAQSAGSDPLAMATSAEKQQWNKLDKVRNTLDSLAPDPAYRLMLERATWLQGVLYWQIQSDYRVRLWETRKQLRDMEQTVKEASLRQVQIARGLKDVRSGFDGYDRRIDALRDRIRDLLSPIQTARANTSMRIQRLALRELEIRKQRLVSYRNQARYALARGYDQLASTPDKQP